jgi:large subunit ribosomal protein L19
VADVRVVRRGHVRRAKLYYLRGRVGKATKVREKLTVGGKGAKAKRAAAKPKAEASDQ